MKLKNKEIRKIYPALLSAGNHQGDIKVRWTISKLASKFSELNELIDIEINNLVDEEGVKNEEGNKILSPQNKKFVELMNLTNDIDCNYLSFEELEALNPSVQEMIALQPLVKEGD